MSRDFDQILDECIDRMNGGEGIEECLASYPEHAQELEPALRAIFDIRAAYSFTPIPAAKATARQRFYAALDGLERKRQERRAVPRRLFRWSWAWAGIAAVLLLGVVGYALMTTLAPAEAGILEVRVTDAPPQDVSEILVSVEDIQVHKAGAGEGSGWITIVEEEKTFDLIKISGVEEVLGSKEIAAADYTQIRMDVLWVEVTINGQKKMATIPSGTLKIVRPFSVEKGEKTILTLDFDAENRVTVTSKGEVKFRPVVKVLVRKAERS
jgi:hypothetical protein